MALVSSNQYGASYLFGFSSGDAPTITGFVARGAELRYEAEAWAAATDGEGVTEAITTTKPEKRKITATFNGYVITGFDPSTIADSFTFLTRKYIVRNVTQPKRKGEYNEASLECESYANITTGPF
jgi:hypothetical protein